MHRATPKFWESFDALEARVQTVARNNFELLKENPKHPSLHFKNVGDFWSVRAGLNYRALAVKDGEDFIWVWIGNHSDYDRLIS